MIKKTMTQGKKKKCETYSQLISNKHGCEVNKFINK